MLSSIRNRLSIYQVNTSAESSSTLGNRIKNSLRILKFPSVPIQSIIMALIDLDKVTRLSPECCLVFTREGAIEILYNFILNCNRSVPHMDLIKLCLQILINLSKYTQSVEYILQPPGSLNILSNLLQAYQSTNPNIFMDSCIIFILLSQNESIKNYILRQDNFINKLRGIYAVLERRATLREKRCSLGSKEQLNSTLGLSVSTSKKSLTILFTFLPEWSLAKKRSIELVDPLGALDYLLTVIDAHEQPVTNSLSSKTPKKVNH